MIFFPILSTIICILWYQFINFRNQFIYNRKPIQEFLISLSYFNGFPRDTIISRKLYAKRVDAAIFRNVPCKRIDFPVLSLIPGMNRYFTIPCIQIQFTYKKTGTCSLLQSKVSTLTLDELVSLPADQILVFMSCQPKLNIIRFENIFYFIPFTLCQKIERIMCQDDSRFGLIAFIQCIYKCMSSYNEISFMFISVCNR